MLFSIITCTHNPNLIVFKQLIKAICAFDKQIGFSYEWLIIDNNSETPVRNLLIFEELTLKCIKFKIVEESSSGLTNARITGINCSQGDWIVFFDDDNQPSQNYLTSIYDLINKYKFVKCWGPGSVQVIFMDTSVKPWIASRKDLFQEKYIDNVSYSNKKHWELCYPAGTGMAIEKKLLKDYITKVKDGSYTLTDRLGKSLSSGGDTQIVFHIVRHGMYAGLSPDLHIDHLIESRKCTFSYLKKQVYTGCKSYLKAHNEVLISNRYPLVFKDNKGVVKRIIRWLMGNYKQVSDPLVALDFFGLLGDLHSPYFAASRNPPMLLRVLINVLVGDK